MNSHEILRTAIKILGLVILINTVITSLRYLPMMLNQLNNADIGMPLISYISMNAVPIIFGLLLWLFPSPVANTIIKSDLKVTSKDELLLGIEKIGIRLLGIYFLYFGISDLVANYVTYNQAMDMFGENVKFSGKEKFAVMFVATGVEILLSLFLIIGAAGISNLIRKIRYTS